MPGFPTNFSSIFSPPTGGYGGYGGWNGNFDMSYGGGSGGSSNVGMTPADYSLSAHESSGGFGSSGAVAGDPKLGLNMGTAQLALGGLATIGNLWAAFQAQKLAREQFKYTKNVTDTNLANQIKTYNTGLADKAGNRAIVYGDPGYKQSYIDANQLKRYGT